MKRHVILAAVFVCLLIAMPTRQALAQHELPSNDLMYHSFRLPQSNQMNPAFFPRNNKVFVTLPSFGFSFGFPISYNDLGLKYNNATDKTELDIFELADKLSDNNQLNFNMQVDLVGFGFKVGRAFFTFQSSAVFGGIITLPNDAFDALTEGSDNLVGPDNAIKLASGDLMTINSYARISLGGGYEFEQIPLTLGAHINILKGIANVNTDETDIRLYAQDQYYSSVVADMSYRFRTAGIASFKDGSLEFDGTPSSSGFTFDLGAQYVYNDFIFSAALIDVGPGIHWNQNVETHKPKSHTITFDGFDITNLINGGEFDNTFARDFRDSLTNIYEMTDEEGGDFWYSIPTKIKLGASYTFLNDMLRAGFLFHGQWDKGIMCSGHGFNVPNNNFRFNTTLSLTANVFDWLEVMVGNSLVFDSHNTDIINPGVGFALTPLKTIQIYVMADYLSNFYAVDSKTFNMNMGFNLLFGNKKSKKESYDPIATTITAPPSVLHDENEEEEMEVDDNAAETDGE